MTADRDLLWADMVQFDPPHADRVWEGDVGDPDAPLWYEHLGDLIHRARGPAEADELLDEPVVVDNLRRAGVGATIRALPRRRGVRTVGRMVAMKATAAATTRSSTASACSGVSSATSSSTAPWAPRRSSTAPAGSPSAPVGGGPSISSPGSARVRWRAWRRRCSMTRRRAIVNSHARNPASSPWNCETVRATPIHTSLARSSADSGACVRR